MATQVPVTLVNGGGALTPRQIKRACCKAFRNAVKDYCTSPPGSRGDFNEKFFEKLPKVKPHGTDLMNNMVREAPVLARRAGGMTASVASLASKGNATAQAVQGAYVAESANLIAGSSSITAAAAATAGIAVPNCYSIGAMFSNAGGKWQFFNSLRAAGYRIGFPDAQIGRQAIEIKGPADSFRKNQKETFDSASRPNPTIVIDCKSCNAKCKNGPKSALKGKWKTNVGCP